MPLTASAVTATPGAVVPVNQCTAAVNKPEASFKSIDEAIYNHSNSSEGDSSDEDVWCPIPVRGVLSKWTNLLHGWQERYFVLSDGTLTYYRNEDEISLGSRGSVRIRTAFVKPHEYDDCRFEVRVGELIWYLRAVNVSQRQSWVTAIERHRVAESGYGSEKTLHRPNSLLSLNSTHSPSIASASSFKRGHRIREKLAEMETFKEILCKQIDSLQVYFDACSAIVDHSGPDQLDDGWLKDEEPTTNSDDSTEDRDLVRSHRRSNRFRTRSISSVDELTERRPSELCFVRSFSTTEDHRISPENTDESSLFDIPDSTKPALLRCRTGVSYPPIPTPIERAASPDQPPGDSQGTKSAATPTAHHTGSTGFFSRFLPSFRTLANITSPLSKSQSPVLNEQSAYSTGHSADSRPRSRIEDLQRILKQHGSFAPDFRGEGHMFKATTVGILANLSHTIEMLMQQEDQWRKRLDREAEKRRRLEETQRAMAQEMTHLRHLIGLNSVSHSSLPNHAPGHPQSTSRMSHARLQSCGQLELQRLHSTDVPPISLTHKPAKDNRALLNLVGPDFEEGPNSCIREEEFYDAIDAESDKIEQDAARLAALRSVGKLLRSAKAMPSSHPLHVELEQAVLRHIRDFANSEAFRHPSHRVPDNNSGELTDEQSVDDWRVITQDGELIIYKREVETEDGVVLDPLQAVHVVHGVTAREMCTYFWDVQYRMEWEFTIDQAPVVLEVCGDDTVVLHQVYKRVWPTTQRDGLFWSHIRQVGSKSSATGSPVNDSVDCTESVVDSWIVVNMSTNYLADKVTQSSSPLIRLGLDVVLYCQTVIDSSATKSSGSLMEAIASGSLSRDQMRTRLVYMANINPGGWVPAAGLRSLARREYPRFLKRFSAYVQDQTRDKPPLF